MSNTHPDKPSPLVEKIAGTIAGEVDDALGYQSQTLADCKKYRQRYLSNNRLNSVHKVYVSGEMHELITRVVSAVGKDKVSAGAYLTEIVKDHFERNRDTVNAIYLMQTRPLF